MNSFKNTNIAKHELNDNPPEALSFAVCFNISDILLEKSESSE